MRACPDIPHLRLDHRSQQGLDEIRSKLALAKFGAAITGGGVLAQIFYRSSSAHAAYNITQTDWKLMAESMSAWPVISQKVVRDIALYQALDHQNDLAQRRFWEAMADGCTP
ncbi:hypothetical protein [Collimonas arenae]|uniref:hypothetical protein n=1 Tax=Collimonas arenae TaxID=279058 RepID=UPI0005707250|nr:hypothetical protein [Collimonas arenae]